MWSPRTGGKTEVLKLILDLQSPVGEQYPKVSEY